MKAMEEFAQSIHKDTRPTLCMRDWPGR